MRYRTGGSRTRAAVVAATLLSACTNELSPTGALAARLAKGDWADSLAVAEIATLAVTLTANGTPITGVGLSWASTDSSVATVSRAPSGGPGESLRALVVGRGAGQATIVVRITQAGFASDSLRVPIVVRRADSDSLTVGDVSTVSVTLARTDPSWRTGAKVEWTSNDPSVAQVVVSSTDPTRATVTARASGRAQVAATVTSDRLDRTVLQLPIRVGAVQLTPATAWPDTLTVTDTMRLGVTTSRAGATVRWSSTNVAAFRVDANGVVTAYAQGGGELVASVGEAGFEVAEFRKALVVQPLVVAERTPWPSSINLTNTATFEVAVQDARGQPKSLPVTWRSTNETAFSVDASGNVVGKSRGGGELIAAVGTAPFQVSELRKSMSVRQKWSSVTAGYLHTCAIAAIDRSAWCWGLNDDGQLGNGATRDAGGQSLPSRVASALPFSALAAGGGIDASLWWVRTGGVMQSHTCGVVGANAIVCWGSQMRGQVGDGSNCSPFGLCSRPLPSVVGTSPGYVEELTVGDLFACATIRTDEVELWCWGSLFGPVPILVAASCTGLTAIAGGGGFFCEDLLGPGMKCTGANLVGQLGSGGDFRFTGWERVIEQYGDSSRLAPLRAASLTAGGEHACSISDSRVWCWGSNAAGQLGTVAPANLGGPAFSRGALPVTLPTQAQVIQVAAGGAHTCAVVSGGDAYCWGSNSHGQLGNGASSASRNDAPAEVLGGLKFARVTTGGFHTCGVTLDGSLYCWGQNGAGQLGDGTRLGERGNRLTPVRVGEAP